MAQNLNSATRLHRLLQQAENHANDKQVMETWAKIFAITEPRANKRALLVAERLAAMLRELEQIQTQMRQADFSDSLYASALTNIEQCLSSMLLSGSWSQVKQYLQRETLIALAFCSEIIPDEESDISPGALTEISNLVGELRSSLLEADISPRLRKLIEHHIALIEGAIAEYPIAGAKAFREAARTGLGELIEVRDVLKEEKNSPPVSKLDTVWKRVNETADIALKAERISQLGQKAWALLENLL